MVDTLAQIMIVLAPLLVLIGTLVFLYLHREQWRAEMKALREPKGECFALRYENGDPMPARIYAKASELGVTPEALIKELVANHLAEGLTKINQRDDF
ncbi:MAG: hypothetical protein HLUCCO02_05455 [Idiomarinaceae bacterium HL-53]|nr:MAG: hypothetical protein HLUCCO02_05455 [Idiomarinaceae bacterium HL-53]CUS48004.1 hypothetical protein Ga0003345_0943 [Idiomarinaceae bacterium HL-53]